MNEILAISSRPSNGSHRGSIGPWGHMVRMIGLVVMCVAGTSGCQLKQWASNGFKVGPEYCRPSAPLSQGWIDSTDQRVELSLPQYADWWSVFEDPTMNSLIDVARSQNLSLQEILWRVEQARDARRIAAGNMFPQLQYLRGGYTHLQSSRAIPVDLPPPLRSFDNWEVKPGFAWELDIWGRYRRNVQSADAKVEQVVGDYDAALLTLIADVALTYNTYRINEQRLQYVNKNIEIQSKSLRLAEERFDAGKTGHVSVNLAKSSLAQSRSLKPLIETALRQSTNNLSVLLAMPPQDMTQMLAAGPILAAPPSVAVGVPADLVRRRPDIRAAERALAAQSEQIGIALTALYPSFTISGEIGYRANHLSDLFTGGANEGFIGPSFDWNILNYGRILANVDLQTSGLNALIQRYRNTVLQAQREVENSLVSYLKSQERLVELQNQADEVAEALRLVQIEFDEGEIDFTPVFIMQDILVVALDELATGRGDVSNSLIQLNKALGGGWEVRCPNAQIRGVSGNGIGFLDPMADLPVGLIGDDMDSKDGKSGGKKPAANGKTDSKTDGKSDGKKGAKGSAAAASKGADKDADKKDAGKKDASNKDDDDVDFSKQSAREMIDSLLKKLKGADQPDADSSKTKNVREADELKIPAK